MNTQGIVKLLSNLNLTCLMLVMTSHVGATGELPRFQARDVFDLEYAAEPAVSPDGKHIIFARRSFDIMTDSTRSSLWIARAARTDSASAGAESNSTEPLLADGENYRSVRWSPDGSRIAYLAQSQGKTQIWVRWMDTGRSAVISQLEYSPRSLTWSPDGSQLAFLMDLPDDNKPLKVSMPDKPKGAKWSEPVRYVAEARYQRDGRGIVDPAWTHLFVIPAEGGTPRQVTHKNVDQGGTLAWAADGQSVFMAA
ncbi:MAG: PD40 domain-containing protein, partial [Pseudomonadales bacterium]|nr:PD40 domain-containing protein [Pseudomonadales bacterium]